jgi:hypothetical protein
MSIQPIERDFKDIREVRQLNNNAIVYESINRESLKEFLSNINIKEFERTLKDLELSQDEFLEKCKNDRYFCKLASRLLSKCASRQGSKDEAEQFRTCNLITKQFDIHIKNLTATELRPTKDGNIYSKEEIKKLKIPMDCCLKSFDGSISGKMTGYISSKISFADGGHQGNVFEEMDTLAGWWSKYQIDESIYLVLLIDTNLTDKFSRIRDKYSNIKNILVFNHVEFQQYVIKNYSLDNM